MPVMPDRLAVASAPFTASRSARRGNERPGLAGHGLPRLPDAELDGPRAAGAGARIPGGAGRRVARGDPGEGPGRHRPHDWRSHTTITGHAGRPPVTWNPGPRPGPATRRPGGPSASPGTVLGQDGGEVGGQPVEIGLV